MLDSPYEQNSVRQMGTPEADFSRTFQLGAKTVKRLGKVIIHHTSQIKSLKAEHLEYHPFCHLMTQILCIIFYRERSGSVVECLTRDRRAAGSSLTGVTAL